KKQKLDKWPALKGWQGAATADPEQIKKWWQIFSAAIPGIELGRSDLFAVDLDRHPGGADGVAAFKTFRGNNHAPECPTVKTSSGGYHLYFRQPEREKLGNGTGSLPPGIDCRGEGGWTVAPGAVFGAGQCQLTGNSSRLSLAPPLPDYILTAIRTRKSHTKSSSRRSTGETSKRERAYAKASLNSSAEKVSAALEGKRNYELNASAFCMGTMI